jgi:hypothetical protein
MKTKVLNPAYMLQKPFGAILFILSLGISCYIMSWMLWFLIFLVITFIFIGIDYKINLGFDSFFSLINFMSILSTSILLVWRYKLGNSTILARRLVNSYLLSIQEALRTEYPDGVVYILDNILKQFKRFDLDLRPYKVSAYSGGVNNIYAIIIFSSRRSDAMGFPNLANLREAMKMAQDLSQEWLKFSSTERSRGMTEIRAKIKEEEMQISFGLFAGKTGFGMKKVFALNKVQDKNVYWFSYTEEDHRNNQSFSHSTPQTPTPTPQPSSNSSQVLSFEELMNQNPILQELSEQEQLETYQKYLTSKGVNLLSFDEWLSQNPEYQVFSEEEQKQAYYGYLKSGRNY